jgi:cytochrome c551/c552
MKELSFSMNKQSLDRPEVAKGEEQDLQKREACGFCHQSHSTTEACQGFA